MKLDTTHIDTLPTLEAENYLRQHGYKIETKAIRVIESDSNADKAYLAKHIRTTAIPFDEADVAADTFETVLCSCPACRFQSLPDLNDRSMASFSPCKHALVFREEKAKQDEQQMELVE
jgi:hypothetical protein